MISPPEKPPRICLIGVSGYASVYVDWLLQAVADSRISIGAVVALEQEQQLPATVKLRAAGATLYDSYEALFASENHCCDLCYIPTGIQWHARMAIAALRAGCNVLVEKPLAGSLQDAKSVQEVEKETGRWVAVGFQDMYTDEMAALKQSLLDGKIGAIRSISMIGAWPRPERYYQRNHWAGRLQADSAQVLDSPLNNAFAHFVNLSLFLAGKELYSADTAKATKACLLRAHNIESFDTAVVHGRGESGVRFWFGVSHACSRTREPSIRVVGDRGTVDWRHEDLYTIKIGDKISLTQKTPCYEETRRKMFDTVLDRLSDPNVPICRTEVAICHTAFIESVHQAASIANVDPACIDRISLDGADSTVPAIRGIEGRLEKAFDNLSDLGDLQSQALAT